MKTLFICIVLVQCLLAETKRADDFTWSANLLDSPFWSIRDISNSADTKIQQHKIMSHDEQFNIRADHIILFKIPKMENNSWKELYLEIECELHDVTAKLLLPDSQIILDRYCKNKGSNKKLSISAGRKGVFATVNGELVRMEQSEYSYELGSNLAIEVKRVPHKGDAFSSYLGLRQIFIGLKDIKSLKSRENNVRQDTIPDSGNGWTRFFYDDFDSTAIDTTKWSLWNGDDTTNKTHYNRSLVLTDAGAAILRNRFINGVFSSSAMSSKIDYTSYDVTTPSRWDIRLKIPKSSAVAYSISLWYDYSAGVRFALLDDPGGNRSLSRSVFTQGTTTKTYTQATNLSNYHTVSLIIGQSNVTVQLDGNLYGTYDGTDLVGHNYFWEIKTLMTCDPTESGTCLIDGPSNNQIDLSIDWIAAFYVTPPAPTPQPTPAPTPVPPATDPPVVTTDSVTTGKKIPQTPITPVYGETGPSKGTLAAAIIVPVVVLIVVGGIVAFIVLRRRGGCDFIDNLDLPSFGGRSSSSNIAMTTSASTNSTTSSPYSNNSPSTYSNNSTPSNNSYNDPYAPPRKVASPPPVASVPVSSPGTNLAAKGPYSQAPKNPNMQNPGPGTGPGRPAAKTNAALQPVNPYAQAPKVEGRPMPNPTTPYAQMHPISTPYQPGALSPTRPNQNGSSASSPNQLPGRPGPNSQSVTNLGRPTPARTLPASMSDPGRIPGKGARQGPATSRPVGANGKRSALPEAPRVVQNCNIDFNEIEIQSELGRGAFGVVHMGLFRGAKVAVKQVILNNEEELENFTKEINLMMSIRPHSNVIQLLGVTWDPHAVVTEFMPNGSLNAFLFSSKPMSPAVQKKMIVGIAKGMQHLHKEGIIHRDLAARNVLLAGDFEPQISDFGLSRINKSASNDNQTKSDVGPLKWMAPESLNSRIYSFKSDVWAYGVTVLEILSRDVPYPTEDALSVAAKVMMAGYKPSIPPNVSPVLIEVLNSCFQEKPAQRPDFAIICNKLARM